MKQTIWVFGYGSLIWRPDFNYLQKQRCVARGWARKFWQGSHDHRGTAEVPGRVVTLIRQTHENCVGMAYEIDASVATAIFTALDHREKNGYQRVNLVLALDNGRSVDAFTYIAMQDNIAFLGDASDSEIAIQMFHAAGESGNNADYLFGLADALRKLQANDEHVFGIEKQLKNLMHKQMQ